MADTVKLSAFVRNEIFPVLVDNVFQYSPLLHFFKENAEPAGEDGGLKLQTPLLMAKSKGGSFSGDDILDTTRSQKFDYAEVDWKQKYVNISIVGRDLILSQGGKGVTLKKAEFIAAELTMQELLSKGFFDDGSGDANKEINGLKAIIADADPAPGAYGGIARATNAWWKAQRDHNSGTGRAATLPLFQTMYGLCSQGNDSPEIIVTSQEVYNKMWGLLQGMQRTMAMDLFAGTKHQYISFNNGAIVADKYIPSDATSRHRAYYLNAKYINLKHHFTKSDMGMWLEDYGGGNNFIKPTNQDVYVGKMYWMGNLTSGNCRMLGVIEDINPAA